MKHAVRKETVLEINGIPIGNGLSVEYVDGAPDFGICEWLDCDETASAETLLGRQFCIAHFGMFYSPRASIK